MALQETDRADERLRDGLARTAAAIEGVLDRLIPTTGGPDARVFEAMRYSVLDGGKRLRPFLVVNGAALFEVPDERALRAAAAIEFIHCYSLIHDDLPAMDDDDLRRGRATNHKQFDEASAILAGDALQALAFEVLADPLTHADAGVRCELVAALAHAAGGEGMVGGQMFDLAAERMVLDLDAITRLQAMKTGALFGFCCQAGAILGQASDSARAALADFARDFGLLFQITDDLLDAEGDLALVGKAVGKDAEAGKGTFVGLLGTAGARQRARDLALAAQDHLAPFGDAARPLRDVARYVVDRKN